MMEYKEHLTDKDLEGFTDNRKGEMIANSASLTSTVWISHRDWYAYEQWDRIMSTLLPRDIAVKRFEDKMKQYDELHNLHTEPEQLPDSRLGD